MDRMPVKLRTRMIDLTLRTPLATAQGAIARRRVWLVAADDGRYCGWGEAAPLPGFGGEPPEHCELLLDRVQQLALPDDLDARGGLGPVDARFAALPCARAAIEGALLDLAARRAGLPLARHLAADASPDLPVNALANGDLEVASAVAARFNAIKLKSCGDPTADAARIRSLHHRFTGIHWRLDANGAWDRTGAAAFARLAGQLVEYVEQPLPADDLAGCADLRRQGLAVALDEGVRTVDDLARAIAAAACDVVVLKPGWLGGYAPTLACAGLAASAGVRIVLTSTLGSAVGAAHTLHLAAALRLNRLAHGLDTGRLLAADVAERPLAPAAGRVTVPSDPGLGIGVVME
jgi:o-succinylbenzoate synthase